MRSFFGLVAIGCLIALTVGCDQRQKVVPVSGKVVYKNKPLTNGSVMFQPEGGIPASGRIGPDGAFTLSTYVPGDGATVGLNKVRVVSTTVVEEDPSLGELQTGSSLIPEHYNSFGTTTLEFEVVEPGHSDILLELTD